MILQTVQIALTMYQHFYQGTCEKKECEKTSLTRINEYDEQEVQSDVCLQW